MIPGSLALWLLSTVTGEEKVCAVAAAVLAAKSATDNVKDLLSRRIVLPVLDVDRAGAHGR